MRIHTVPQIVYIYNIVRSYTTTITLNPYHYFINIKAQIVFPSYHVLYREIIRI